jgi:hypothetical protein
VARELIEESRSLQGHTKLPDYHAMPARTESAWRSHIVSVGTEGYELAKALMQFDPTKRLSAKQVCSRAAELTLGVASSLFHVIPTSYSTRSSPKTSCRAATQSSTAR